MTPTGKVDFIYRNIQQVDRVIARAEQGSLEHDFFQQPAYGFASPIYLAETQICLPLYDPQGIIAALKARVAVYPPLLKEKSTASLLWLAEFTLIHAQKFAGAGDIFNTAGALTRAAYLLGLALFALNETYYLTDKTALREIAAFRLAPLDYGPRVSAILARPGETPAALSESVRSMRELWSEVVALTGGAYRPAFQLK